MSRKVYMLVVALSLASVSNPLISMGKRIGALVTKKQDLAKKVSSSTYRFFGSQTFKGSPTLDNTDDTAVQQKRLADLTTKHIPFWQREKEEAQSIATIVALTTLNMGGLMTYAEGLPLSSQSLLILGAIGGITTLPLSYIPFSSYQLRKRIAEKKMLEAKIESARYEDGPLF